MWSRAWRAGAGWILMFGLVASSLAQPVFITEFMAANGGSLRDEDGDSSDWIELFNAGTNGVNLGGWFLTDSSATPTKWQFPSVTLAPGAFLVVFASEKNRTNPAALLHTNFKLGAAGEYLGLIRPDAGIENEYRPAYPAQTVDVSYGYLMDGASILSTVPTTLPRPTPGGPNWTNSAAGFPPEPTFSQASGIYTNDSITLALTAPPGAILRYTLDGSEPTAASALYTEPLLLTTNTLIKARTFSSTPGLWFGPVVARTFVLLDASTRDFDSNLPILVISTQGRPIDQQTTLSFQRTKGIFVSLDTFRGRSSLQGKTDSQGLAGFEVAGQTSAGFEKKPLRIELNDELGNDRSTSLLGLPAESDWRLLAPHNDKTFLNDFLGFELWEELGHYSCRRRLVELFLDTGGGKLSYPGDYYGVMVLCETIKIARNRVALSPLSPTDANEPEVSGGYLIKKDKDSVGDTAFTTTGGGIPAHSGQTLKFHDPKPDEITLVQSNYIRNFVNQFEASMYAPGWTNATGTNHYSYYIDVDAFVDQHLHVEFTKQIEGYRLSSFYHKDREEKLQPGPVWDWGSAFGNANYLQGGKTNGWYWNDEPEGMNSSTHTWLRRLIYGLPSITAVAPYTSANGPGDPDFRQKITDRWNVVRRDVLNGDRLLARIDELSSYLAEAAARNFSKYPTVLNTYQWPNPEGPPAWDVDYTQPTYQAIISEMKKWTKGRFVWMDSQFLPAPWLGQPEGPIAAGTWVDLGTSQGTIYYTVDGTDPRLPGGGISPSARIYSAPLELTTNARVVARAYANPTPRWTPWSAPTEATYVVATPPLVVSEIMYAPSALPATGMATEELEYLEVQNVGAGPLQLANFRLRGGINFVFPDAILQPGQRATVAKNPAAFANRYDSNPILLGPFDGNLGNEGDRIILEGPLREPVLDFRYDPSWYPITRGAGFSLAIVDEHAPADAWNTKPQWRPSSRWLGTPGREESPPPLLPPVVINEVLARSVPPNEDAVEMFNPGPGPADISGWFLSDDLKTPKKFRIPAGTLLSPGGYLAFDEHAFNPFSDPPINTAFSFGATDEVYLFSADPDGNLTGYAHGFKLTVTEPDVTLGRHLLSTGEERFVPQESMTFAEANSGPRISPVVISEIMYHPRDLLVNHAYWNNTEEEYIELHNRTLTNVMLSDPTRPAWSWKLDQATQFTFPPGTGIPAKSYLLVVSFDPLTQPSEAAAFRLRYGLSNEVPLVGPFTGSLDNDQGTVSLVMPDDTNTNVVPTFIPVDSVRYHDRAPWPIAADGFGQSLQRALVNAYGDDPANWFAGAPTPDAGFAPGPPPTILTQPLGVTVPDSGQASATFRGTASGPGPLRYQWTFNGAVLPTATNQALTLTNIQSSQAGEYRLAVLNPFGAAFSAPAKLDLLFLPKITAQPGNLRLLPGTNATFFVLATSQHPPLRYQWFHDGFAIPGATNFAYLLANVQDTDEGGYQAVLTDGNGTVASEAATLTLLLPPQVVQPVPPLHITAVAGENVTLSVHTRGVHPMLYRWRRVLSTGAALILTNRILNVNSDFLLLTNVSTNLNGSYFQVILTNELYTLQNLAFTNAYLTVLDDVNGNGLPDPWESTYFGTPTGASRDADPDGDGMSNYAEYLAGTDPTDPSSYLKIEPLFPSVLIDGVRLEFFAVSNRTYTVEFQEDAPGSSWSRLTDVPASSAGRVVTLTDPRSRDADSHRRYRLVTPHQP